MKIGHGILSILLAGLGMMAPSGACFASFASNEVYLASVGRGAGSGGAQFYSTIWVTNLSSSATVHFTFTFLKDGQSNLSGAPSFADTLSPGQTKLYENVTETKLSLPGQFGAARITADGEIFASERVYNLANSTDNLGTSEGLFFAAVPKSFAIGMGETASIQGVNQGSPTENMRSNFDLVETTGNSCTVHVTLLDQNGTSQGATDVNMVPYGHVKQSAQALLHSIATINDRIVATVTSGSGNVILAGEQLANTSQDSSGFEMSFKDSLLGGGGVTSLNGRLGALTIAHGANTTVNVNGSTITIDAVAGSGTGLTAVAHDNSLAGSGTISVPLAIANGQVVRSLNGMHDAITLAAGSNVTLTPSGQTITIASTGGSGGLTLPYSGSASTNAAAFMATNNSALNGAGIAGQSNTGGDGVYGLSSSGIGVLGQSSTSDGVRGDGQVGVHGTSDNSRGVFGEGGSYGVYGQSANEGVHGTGTATGVFGQGGPTGVFGQGGTYGVYGMSAGYGVEGSGGVVGVDGRSDSGLGVFGLSNSGEAVAGESTSNIGVYGVSGSSFGVEGESSGGSAGVAGYNHGGAAGIYGKSDNNIAGYFEGNVTVTGAISAGMKDFKIDHPLDPANKYLVHASVESSEMKNLYDGEVTLDSSGTAAVTMPDWFSAENDHVRYQLTAIGTPQPGLFIAARLNGNTFRIAGGVPGAEVSWMVTGVRRDAYARAHPLVVEEVKPDIERGSYLHPEEFGQPEEKGLSWARWPEAMRQLKADKDRPSQPEGP